jgi:hypothetical protein
MDQREYRKSGSRIELEMERNLLSDTGLYSE